MKKPSPSIAAQLLCVFLGIALAQFETEGVQRKANAADEPTRKPASALKFDDSVIEGVEKKPLASVDVIGNRGKDGKLHTLYKKRVDFEDKNAGLFQQLRNSP